MSVFGKLRRSTTNGGRKDHTVDPPQPLNHLSSTEYAKRCKLILELRADIQNLDLDDKDTPYFDFPRLVVIGDQSAGKSSLVEAVSGINVPRDSGTCTRCPMECFLRSTADSQWSCSIRIQLTSGTVDFGPEIYDRSSVELWIRRAQAAILSPHLLYTSFLSKSENQLKSEQDPKRLQFSDKSVLIEIKDPQSPDLDFVDLPGIIHAGEPISLVGDVVHLVESFINRPNTLILTTMQMTNDWKVQKAVRLAREADPDGDRTIGILTKPDRLQDGDIGSRESWKKILANEDEDCLTRHGYYCVRLPDDLERKKGITRDEALKKADDFFSSHAPWNQMKDRSRFGIPNFVKNISALLVEHIEKYIPALEEQVKHLLRDCLKEIAELPPLLDKAPSTEIHLRISAFCQAFKDAVLGRDNRHFVQANKRRYSGFSQDIDSTKPRYILPNSDTRHAGTGPCLNLAEVREVKNSTITWELPPHVHFDATIELVQRCTKLWEDPSLKCFDDIVDNSIKIGDKLLRTHFRQYGELLDFVGKLTDEERGRCQDETRRILKTILQFESIPLYTQDTEFLSSERTKWLTTHDPNYEYNRRHGRSEHTYSEEYDLMASSYAYFQVAHKRIIDYVPLAIEHGLNQALVKNLEILLITSVTQESATPGRLEELVQEDSTMAKRRQRLEKRRKDLLKIQEKINYFWSLSNMPSQSRVPGSNRRRNSSVSDYHSLNHSVPELYASSIAASFMDGP